MIGGHILAYVTLSKVKVRVELETLDGVKSYKLERRRLDGSQTLLAYDSMDARLDQGNDKNIPAKMEMFFSAGFTFSDLSNMDYKFVLGERRKGPDTTLSLSGTFGTITGPQDVMYELRKFQDQARRLNLDYQVNYYDEDGDRPGTMVLQLMRGGLETYIFGDPEMPLLRYFSFYNNFVNGHTLYAKPVTMIQMEDPYGLAGDTYCFSVTSTTDGFLKMFSGQVNQSLADVDAVLLYARIVSASGEGFMGDVVIETLTTYQGRDGLIVPPERLTVRPDKYGHVYVRLPRGTTYKVMLPGDSKVYEGLASQDGYLLPKGVEEQPVPDDRQWAQRRS